MNNQDLLVACIQHNCEGVEFIVLITLYVSHDFTIYQLPPQHLKQA